MQKRLLLFRAFFFGLLMVVNGDDDMALFKVQRKLGQCQERALRLRASNNALTDTVDRGLLLLGKLCHKLAAEKQKCSTISFDDSVAAFTPVSLPDTEPNGPPPLLSVPAFGAPMPLPADILKLPGVIDEIKNVTIGFESMLQESKSQLKKQCLEKLVGCNEIKATTSRPTSFDSSRCDDVHEKLGSLPTWSDLQQLSAGALVICFS